MFALPVLLEQPPSWPAFSKPALHSLLTAGIYCCCSDRAVVLFWERDALNVERLEQQLAWHSDNSVKWWLVSPCSGNARSGG
jgi:hypothetical protein